MPEASIVPAREGTPGCQRSHAHAISIAIARTSRFPCVIPYSRCWSPPGWENMSIEDLPVGSNIVSFSRAKTGRGIEYGFQAKENGWHFVLRGDALSGAEYYLNGRRVASTSSGIRMSGRKNHVLVVQH